jgi:hypothetical protein
MPNIIDPRRRITPEYQLFQPQGLDISPMPPPPPIQLPPVQLEEQESPFKQLAGMGAQRAFSLLLKRKGIADTMKDVGMHEAGHRF